MSAISPPLPSLDRTRFRILALLAVGTMINYLDRTVLGIAATRVSLDLRITPEIMGIVFSAFSWSYAAAQIPGGLFLDRFGSKLTYFLAVNFWSLFTLLQGVATGPISLIGFRLGLGVSEAPCFPVNNRVVTAWFPDHERARATAIYTVGEYLGLACFGPLLFWIAGRFGWRPLFFVVGVAGMLFTMAWQKGFREPVKDRGDLLAHAVARLPFSWIQVRKLLRHRQIWGACIGQFGGNSTLVFFLTWFPTYLATERHLTWIRAGFFSVMPFLAAAVGVLAGGWASDGILKTTGSRNWARKLPVIAGLLGASTIILANFTQNNAIMIAILSFAFLCQGMAGLGWAVVSDIAPLQMAGLTGGIFNFSSNLAGVLTPIVVGIILGATGSFYYALAYTGGVALLGALSYIFVLGDVKRIEIDQ